MKFFMILTFQLYISIADAYGRLGKARKVKDHLLIAMDLDSTDIEAEITDKLYF